MASWPLWTLDSGDVVIWQRSLILQASGRLLLGELQSCHFLRLRGLSQQLRWRSLGALIDLTHRHKLRDDCDQVSCTLAAATSSNAYNVVANLGDGDGVVRCFFEGLARNLKQGVDWAQVSCRQHPHGRP